MRSSRGSLLASVALLTTSLLLSLSGAIAATQPVDLDALPANAAESMCSTNILTPFPVRIENKVTNRANGDAFTFSWPSAGPGGFTSSVPAGTPGGVGATWVWTTNESVVGFTGSSCATDICFAQTSGPDALGRFCSDSCVADGTTVSVRKSGATGVELSWTGGTGTFTVYRGSTKIGVVAPTNSVGTTNNFVFIDTPPANSSAFYVVRGSDCTTRKPCTTNADCNLTTEGICVSRGPFGVPGRSLLANEVTVSAASLTSSLITFFSPPVEVFRATSTTNAGGVAETLTNPSSNPVTVTVPAFPPGCCPYNPDQPHQIRCGDECVNYLDDPDNCGACGNDCGNGGCCLDGTCFSICAQGEAFCEFEDEKGSYSYCADLDSDSWNCGECGNECGEAACCEGGVCQYYCGDDGLFCDDHCVDPDYDEDHCGECNSECGSFECCDEGQCGSPCQDDWTVCKSKGIYCADLRNDNQSCGKCGLACESNECCQDSGCELLECPYEPGGGWYPCGDQCFYTFHDDQNCGACGNVCPVGTCCNGEGTCNPACGPTETQCGDQCVDLANDSGNCGDCGWAVPEGYCCQNGGWASLCDEKAGFRWCNDQCVHIYSDPNNCGGCGETGDTCDEAECCGEGNCVEYTSPLCGGEVPPQEPFCPNENASEPYPASCPIEKVEPQPAICPNPYTTESEGAYCPGDDKVTAAVGPIGCGGGAAPPDKGDFCAGDSPYPPPQVEEAPVCTTPETTTVIPPGGSLTTCTPGGPLFKEVPTSIVVCGDGIPGVDGTCNGSTTRLSTGPFSRLVPVAQPVGNAFVTPYSVRVALDFSYDGMLQPGELGALAIDLLNAGPIPIHNAMATLDAPAIDLSGDGVSNPLGIEIDDDPVPYGTILETAPATDCVAPPVRPASSSSIIPVFVPPGHPGDTSHPLSMTVTGSVGGAPFTQEVPLSIGIADWCNYSDHARDFDSLYGLKYPMARLVAVGNTVRFPAQSFVAGARRVMRLRVKCGFTNLGAAEVDAPEIVGLTEAVRGPIDLATLFDEGTDTNTTLFRWDNDFDNDPDVEDGPEEGKDDFVEPVEEGFAPSPEDDSWVYKLRTSNLGPGRYTITIRIAGQRDYVTGFVLE